ncbi:type II secretion system protein N [Rhodoferax sp.]|uniref:type II secretion system protein N n=1 Tax=Rhodoferax sp. TaxID=50421 RepID=UPI002723662A|nr:type II secretion system protein N [Rhodoferax sp.]MDO9196588.1 type II secretion system protein N [Rhodoferax sp.]
MQTQTHGLWGLRIITFSVAALAAASATYWVLKWTAPAPARPGAAVNFAGPSQADPQVVARLLGGGQTGVAAAQAVTIDTAASRFKLTGVVADRAKGGYALISVDGKPARPYRVGTLVDNALVLQSVAPRSAALAASADAPVSIILDLPKLAQP